VIPGEYLLGEGDIEANVGRRTVQVTVANTGDRPVQVGSHFHFFEANRALRFDRGQAFGMRLNVPAGTAVRFEPGDEKIVTLVELAGAREVYGLNALTDGPAGAPRRARPYPARFCRSLCGTLTYTESPVAASRTSGSSTPRLRARRASAADTPPNRPRTRERTDHESAGSSSANSEQHGDVLAHLREQRWLGFGMELCLCRK